MLSCGRCGAQTPSGRFCAECGAPLALQSAPSLEETNQKALLFPSTSSVSDTTALPVVYVEDERARVNSAPSMPPGALGGAGDAVQRSQSARVTAPEKIGHGGYSDQPERKRSPSGLLKGRYADHPNCDVCGIGFDVTKPRHQCRACGRYVCGNCSPRRLLIPEGEQIDDARGYDQATPQRVCLHCAPLLHQVQDELIARHARANLSNEHEAKGRFHVPFSPSLEKECQNAADIIGNFFRDDGGASGDRSIPISLLENASGLAIMTIVKAGFLLVGKVGTGLVVSRLADGSWSAPSAIGTVGLGGGFEVGGEIVEVMIILGSQAAVQVFHSPQVNLGAGLDIAVGPYGRSATAAAAVSSSGVNANYSYSMSKGLYAGVSLQGSVIATRNDLNRKFYGQDLEPGELLRGSVGQPLAAKPLYDALQRATQGIEEQRAVREEISAMMGSCRSCACSRYVAHVHQVWNKKCKTCSHVH